MWPGKLWLLLDSPACSPLKRRRNISTLTLATSVSRVQSLPPFFFNDTQTTEIYTLSLHDALPISACDELEGSPNHHVSRFHAIAPRSAARTVFVVIRPLSTTSFPTVFATAVVTNAPARFATDATSTAIRGVRARVETDVATAFAVSWKPLVKSKPSATTMTTTSSTSFIQFTRAKRGV